MIKQYSIEELRNLPFVQLSNIDCDSPTYEKLVNQVLNERKVNAPLEAKLNRKDIPDIKTPEQEAEWQKVVDLRTQILTPQVVTEQVLEVPLEAPVVPVEVPKVVETTVTPLEAVVPENRITETPVVPVQVVQFKSAFCDSCDSKGVRHKKECPKYTPTTKIK